MTAGISYPGRERDVTPRDEFASRCVLRIVAGHPVASLLLAVQMDHGSRDGHEDEHAELARALSAAIDRVLESHCAEVVGGIDVEVWT